MTVCVVRPLRLVIGRSRQIGHEAFVDNLGHEPLEQAPQNDALLQTALQQDILTWHWFFATLRLRSCFSRNELALSVVRRQALGPSRELVVVPWGAL